MNLVDLIINPLYLNSLCTDVPPPSGKILSRFFLREGGRLYTGYT